MDTQKLIDKVTDAFDYVKDALKSPLVRTVAFVFAILLALFISTCAVAASSSAMDPARVAEGYVRSDMATLLLMKQEAGCPQGARRAIVYLNQFPAAQLGCWTRTVDKVVVVWDDEGNVELPADQVTWMDKGKPV